MGDSTFSPWPSETSMFQIRFCFFFLFQCAFLSHFSPVSHFRSSQELITEPINCEPNRHTTSNPRRFNVDITSIRLRPNFDEYLRHFRALFRCNFAGRKNLVVSTYFFRCNFAGRKINVISTYFFWCNFDGRKIHIVSTYFFRCNFHDRKIHVVSTYFYRCDFDGRNMHVVFTHFFRRNFDGQRFDIVLGKL